MDPRLARIRRVYDRDPGRYDREMSRGLTWRLTAGARREIAAQAEGRVLEVGIGTGLSLPHYQGGAEVVGIDLSPGMLGMAAERARDLRRRVRLLVMNAHDLAFANESFDTVVFSLCLCTIPDPGSAVAEALRVVRPGGRLLFLEHVRSDLWPVRLLQAAVDPLTVLVMADHFNRPTEQIVRRSGVEVDRVRRWALGVFTLIEGHRPL